MTIHNNGAEGNPSDPWSTPVPVIVILEPSLRAVAQKLARGETRLAAEQCTADARSGNHHAQAALAAFWLFAARDTGRISHATKWARRSHDAGCSHGTYVLGFVALAQENRRLARKWIHEAATRDFSPAMLTLGRFELDGVGGPIDVAAGLAHLRGAVWRGHRLAAITLWAFQVRHSSNFAARLHAQLRLLAATIAWIVARKIWPYSERNNVYIWPTRVGSP
jgi:hypothetical protein